MQNPIDVLKKLVEKYEVKIPNDEWSDLSRLFKRCHYPKRSTIFSQTQVCKGILFITQGIAASEYNIDGEKIISRFLEGGDLCTNMISADYQILYHDHVTAVTDVVGLMMPYKLMKEAYFTSNTFGLFIRKKIFDHHLEMINILSIKTMPDTEKKYRLLEKNYPNMLEQIPSKYVANFLGISPEWMSRLRKKRQALNQV